MRHGTFSATRAGLFLAFVAALWSGQAIRAQPPATAGAAARKLVIISPHSEEIQTEFERAFPEWARRTKGLEVKIEWLDQGGTLQAIRYVDDQFEQSPDGIGVDIFFGGGVDPFLHFSKKGRLHRCNIPPEVLAPIPEIHGGMRVYDAQQRWFGACLAGFGILHNKKVLSFLGLPVPRTWADLGRPDFFTWVASADPRHSGSQHMAYEIILQAYGWRKGWAHVIRIGANCRGFSRGAGDIPKTVAVGDAACGMAIDTYALRAVAEVGPRRMGFVLPSGLTVVNPDAIGVLKGAPEAGLAELFVQFVLSEAGQRLWILRKGAPGGPKEFQLYRLPVIPGLAGRYGDDAMVQSDPFKFGGGIDFDINKKERRRGIMSDLFGACIIDIHPELAAAWKKLKELPEDDPRVQELLKPPVSEAELLRMAGTHWEDPLFRADTMAKWAAEARTKYLRLAEGL